MLPSRRPARIGAWQRKTSGHNVPIAVRYRDGSTPMHTFGVSDTQRWRNASVLSQGKEYRAQCHRPWQASRTGLRRLEALLCLLIITAQLALVVAHSWEVAGRCGSDLRHLPPSKKTRAVLTVISKAATVPRRTSHDPLLCSVCRLLSQVKNGIALHGPADFPSPNSFDGSARFRLP